MESTPQVLGVGEVGRQRAESIATALNELTLKGRKLLPLAANNAHIAPSDPKAADIRRDMRAGDSREWFRLYTVGACDLKDGVPVDVVTAAARQFIAEMEMLSAERDRAKGPMDFVRPLGAVATAAFKAAQRFELAELRVMDSKASLDALEALEAEVDRCMGPLAAVRTTVEHTIAVERAHPREVVGRRNGRMQLHA